MLNDPKNNTPIQTNDNIQINTMKKDLEELKHPQPENANISLASKTPEKIPGSISSQEKPSPFLSNESWNEQREKDKQEEAHLEENGKKGGVGKAVIIGIIIFIILAAGAGGYYYWATRININKEKSELPATTDNQANTQETLPALSADNPNYLSLDIDNSDSAKIKEEIKNYAKKVSALNTDSAVEFIITDSQNNPVAFQKFSQVMGIIFPENITPALGTDFSLYIYNDNGKPRIGLVINVSNESALKTALLAEEPNLPKKLEPIFLATSYTLSNSYSFNSSSYGQSQIRYANITSSENLSTDYSIYNSQLLIGTTKTTLRKMIDYIDAQAKVSQ